MQIHIAQTDEDILKCWPVMHLLRPHLSEPDFLPLIREMMTTGYQLAFIEAGGVAVAAVGYRFQHKLYDGKQFYIDDLSTLDSHRGKGYGGMLLDFVLDSAKNLGYTCVTLDSGPSRHDAHRLYLNKKFRITSMHFTRQLD